MKNRYSFYLVFLLLVACDNSSANGDDDSDILLNKSAKIIVEANNIFAFDFFRSVNKSEIEPNFMVSPVSLSLALGMAYNGAGGMTKTAFEEVLNYDFLTEDVNVFNQHLIDKLSSQDDGSVMEIANSLWINKDFPVYDEFIGLNREYFYAEVANKDFSSSQTVLDVNQWVSDKTNNKIPTVLDEISSAAVLYLVNALYFNATWKYEFDEGRTYIGRFDSYTAQMNVDKMLMTEKLPYLQNDLFSSVVLPYEKDKYSMYILLPKFGVSTDDIIDNLTVSSWEGYLNAYDTTQMVTVDMPKFKLDYKNKLNDELIAMGLGVAFSFSEADFSRISAIPVFISLVLQKTFIDVNEAGTEAAAVTVIGFENTSIGNGPQTLYFNANRPFLYVIKENLTGSICFMGKVGAPEYSEE